MLPDRISSGPVSSTTSQRSVSGRPPRHRRGSLGRMPSLMFRSCGTLASRAGGSGITVSLPAIRRPLAVARTSSRFIGGAPTKVAT